MASDRLARWQQESSNVKGVRPMRTRTTAGTDRWPMITQAVDAEREKAARELRVGRRKAFIMSARGAARGKAKA